MPVQTAEVIDLQAYRQARARPGRTPAQETAAVPPAMFPMLMWVPFWGLVPVMVPAVPGHGV